ncbi:sirohydrochlorin chelatase [Bacillus sp. ISL-39]|uniref:sirohydrochlorin chelatase n=1 Tax=Bacillus sp. ISL-39 TaxID=2819124 RepID=UPI001BEBD4AA|nr:sirohydrochlorin chelatase [Bacillus sp. ISL-39]MBT2640010.1 sirohydrochlorin chelatase [Bacillus sp. ISL-39]
MKAILYIGHGTRSKKGESEAKAFVQRVMDRIDVPIQEISFLELTDPLIAEGFARCVERGATEITVVPLFLLAAGHIKKDIPMVLGSLQEKYPQINIAVKDPFGVHGSILDGVAELVSAIADGVDPTDRLLIVGRGSSDPAILADFASIAEGLKARLGIGHAAVCYLAAAKPTLDEGLEAITQKAGSRVIVVPYLLFSGLLMAEINQKVSRLTRQGQEIIHTSPLSSHQIIEDIVIARAFD